MQVFPVCINFIRLIHMFKASTSHRNKNKNAIQYDTFFELTICLTTEIYQTIRQEHKIARMKYFPFIHMPGT